MAESNVASAPPTTSRRDSKDLQRAVESSSSARHQQSLKARRRRDNIAGYLFMAPQLIGLIVFMLGPLLFAIYLAFASYDGFGSPKFIGLENFKTVFENDQYLTSIKNTLLFTVLQVPAILLSGLVFAWVLQNTGKFKNVYRACFFAPFVTNTVAVSVIWLWLYNPEISPVNAFLKKIGIENPPDWLQDPKFMIPAVVLVSIWQGLGYMVVMFMAGLDNVPGSLLEAADIDGANTWQKMRRITLPLISPTILFLSITSIIGSFQVFDYIWVFYESTAPGPARTIVYEIVQVAFKEFKFGVGAALAMMLFVGLLGVTALQLLAQRRWVHYTE